MGSDRCLFTYRSLYFAIRKLIVYREGVRYLWRNLEAVCMNRFLIFDMDGVLIDSEPFHKEVLKEVFNSKGLDLNDAYYNSLVGMSNRAIWIKAKNDFLLSPSVETLMQDHMDLFFEMLGNREIPQPDGMAGLLERVKGMGIRCSLASSSPMRLIEVFVNRMGIGELLDHMVSGEQLKRSKPFPDIFLKVSECYGESPERFWVIEDSAHGVKAAVDAGMRCIGYQNPLSGNQNLAQADLTIRHFDELNHAALNNLWK